MGGGKGVRVELLASSIAVNPGHAQSVRTTTGPSSVGRLASNACPEANGRARIPPTSAAGAMRRGPIRRHPPRIRLRTRSWLPLHCAFTAGMLSSITEPRSRPLLGPVCPRCARQSFRRPAYVRRGAGPGSAQRETQQQCRKRCFPVPVCMGLIAPTPSPLHRQVSEPLPR